jgi:hypothetical protein
MSRGLSAVTAARLFLKEVIGYERSQNRFNIWPY